ncbi:hypothetical protein [Haloplanus aerogenes]|uniref:Uncharacterized protein n=1 Tax=Haloplanus aerogenes TaxID=660522 RepID=A0A3M0CHC3_9EURY|nr:hypothetical protein [Haloplanus aerogenes]AZH24143.1 hypothetical protein DU502_01580 [Haloplanus aerogenes]RMB08217.1 hypothetical protein ATH50_3684 [Haloplanus aerogenes]
MNRRATLGMSFAELVMVRIGHAVGLLCLLFILPILPFIAVAAAVSALVRPDAETPEPTYRPDWAE